MSPNRDNPGKREPPAGSKLGQWALNTIFLIAVALLAFAFSEDKMRNVRDANIEINLLLHGPRQQFQNACQSLLSSSLNPDFAKEARDGFVEDVKSKGLAVQLSSDLTSEGLIDCPFPSATETVKDALSLTLGFHPPEVVFVSSRLIQDLDQAVLIAKNPSAVPNPMTPFTAESGVMPLLKDMANTLTREGSGLEITNVSVLAYQSDKEKEDANSAFHHYYFSPITSDHLKDIAVCMQVDGRWCLNLKDGDGRYLTGVPTSAWFLRSYFADRIKAEPSYSRPEAADTSPRDWLLINGDPTSTDAPGDWGNALNLPGGFDFPALSARLFDLGDLSVENAARKLSAEFDEDDASWEVLGVKLPGRLFVTVCISALAVSIAVLAWSIKRAGRAALSDVLQDVPPSIVTWVLWLEQA